MTLKAVSLADGIVRNRSPRITHVLKFYIIIDGSGVQQGPGDCNGCV